jgi:pantothenate kinase, type III
MLLTVDIGNTNIVFGGMTDGKLNFMARVSTNKIKTEDEYGADLMSILKLHNVDVKDIEGGIVASVVPPVLVAIKRAVKMVIGKEPVVVSPGIKTGLNILMDNPAAVGTDKIVAAVAALKEFEPPIIIVDMGTATTICVVDKNKNYIGGCIMPGVNISLDALCRRTAQLPYISLEEPKSAIAKNTIDSMRSGIIYGNAAMIEGYVERMESEIGEKCNVVVTGGLGKYITKHCKREFFYSEDLLLKGLEIIYYKNK